MTSGANDAPDAAGAVAARAAIGAGARVDGRTP